MSAFLCSQNHINALVNWATRNSPYGGQSIVQRLETTPQALGELLYNANVRSLEARYGADHGLGSYAYKFKRVLTSPNAVQILKACSCYDYQACEVDDYQQTKAADIIDQIRADALRAVPGYQEAAWEIV